MSIFSSSNILKLKMCKFHKWSLLLQASAWNFKLIPDYMFRPILALTSPLSLAFLSMNSWKEKKEKNVYISWGNIFCTGFMFQINFDFSGKTIKL